MGRWSGLKACGAHSARQALITRIEGLCAQRREAFRQHHFTFAQVEGLVVGAIGVPKAQRPSIYSQNIPYLRQVTAARPMSPDEVVEAILAWEKRGGSAEKPSPEASYLSGLATVLVT